jgi:hypothetical protein
MQQHAFVVASDCSYDYSVLGSGPRLVADVTLQSPLSSPSPPSTPPPIPAVSRPVWRRLLIQAAGHGFEQESSQSAPSIAELESDKVAPSCPGSPEICCSQVRLQKYDLEHSRRYPTPPPAQPKDQYIPPSESEAESSDSERPPRRPPAKILRTGNGQLMYHKAYDGPIPITYVDTRLYQGGSIYYIDAFNTDALIWVCLIHDLLDAHNSPRRNV